MDISWLGNSAVRIRSGQTAVVSDPYHAGGGRAMPDTSADIVTISLDDPRHAYASGVSGSPRVLRGPGEYEIANFYIRGMGTPVTSYYSEGMAAEGTAPDEPEGDSEGKVNTVYAMRAEGVRVCHAGAVVPMLTSRQLDELNNTEVLVVRASGDAAEAKRVARLVNQIGPRIVAPVGWQTGGADGDTSALESLLGELGVTEAASQATLRVTPTSLPREMSVVALRLAR